MKPSTIASVVFSAVMIVLLCSLSVPTSYAVGEHFPTPAPTPSPTGGPSWQPMYPTPILATASDPFWHPDALASAPQTEPLPADPSAPQLPPPVQSKTYNGVTSQGQRLTMTVEHGTITMLELGVQLGLSTFYTAVHQGNLGTVSGLSFSATAANAYEYVLVEGSLSPGQYGEPPNGTFHVIAYPSLTDTSPGEVRGTWRILSDIP